LAKFFDNVQYDILMARVARKVGDVLLLALIGRYLRYLLALGVSKRHALTTASSSKSYWRMSKTLATQAGMTNQWLKDQGLISVRDLWMKAHGYA